MLVGAFFSWPLQNEVGMEAVGLLRDDASIVLAAVGVLGMSLMFGGLHLLSMDMKKGADRMSHSYSTWPICSSSGHSAFSLPDLERKPRYPAYQ